MNCPRCDATLQEMTVKQTPVDRCTQCYGTWVSARALSMLIPGTDTGRRIVQQLDRVVREDHHFESRVSCPECSTNAVCIVEVRGVHIDYCTRCHGVFFDKGEVGRLTREHRRAITQRLERRFRDSTTESGWGLNQPGLHALLSGLFSTLWD